MAERVFLYCDESGAKGYADQVESYPGEVGVFAGILVPENQLGSVSPQFDFIAAQHKPASGKLHIADLPNEQKGLLREAVYEEIRQTHLPCFWYAIHVAGLHAAHKRQYGVLQNIREGVRHAHDGKPPRVKGGSVRDNPASMHEELFAGLYANLVAFLLERQREEVDIEVRTDQINNSLVRDFSQIAEQLLKTGPETTRTTGFDTATREIVQRAVTTEVRYPPELKLPDPVRSLRIEPVSYPDGLVLAADVLANSLNYLFKHRSDADRYAPLNQPKAVAAHPLARYFDSFESWGAANDVGDTVYRHPNAPRLD